jgi:hypothetical protein
MKARNSRLRDSILGCTLVVLFLILTGCEAFVRKFTRKPKDRDLSRPQMVLAPEEYTGPQMSKEELYRQYFLYWRAWQDELILSLEPRANHKKQMDCINQALKNLARIKGLLAAQKSEQANRYLIQLEDLRGLIERDVYSNNIVNTRTKAEQLKRNILRDFSYNKVKDSLI